MQSLASEYFSLMVILSLDPFNTLMQAQTLLTNLEELKIILSFTGKGLPVKLIAFASRLRIRAVKQTVPARRPFFKIF
jgi:hypothetical protein